MSSLQQALPQDEEHRFRQAIQCTICLNSGHSAVECNMRIHCPICHSRAHTVEQCEYNMLNTPTPIVRRIEPHRQPCKNDQGRQEEWFRYAERNQREEHQNRNRYNNNLYSDEEEQEDEDYRNTNRYNKGGHRYGNRRSSTNFGGFNGPRPNAHNRQYRDQRRYDESSEDERRQEPHQEHRQPPRHNMKLQQNQEEQAIPAEAATPPGGERGETSVHCFVCQQPGHYAT